MKGCFDVLQILMRRGRMPARDTVDFTLREVLIEMFGEVRAARACDTRDQYGFHDAKTVSLGDIFEQLPFGPSDNRINRGEGASVDEGYFVSRKAPNKVENESCPTLRIKARKNVSNN